MSEEIIDQEENPPSNVESVPESEKKSPIRIVTALVLLLCVVIFIWYVKADRHTPFTDQARIYQVIVPISPRVSGYLTDIRVNLHSKVKQGDTLFKIDKRPFELALRKAQADLDNTLQQIGAGNADVQANASNVGVAKAALDRAERNYRRMDNVYKSNPGAVSQADRDRVETSLDQAREKLHSNQAKLEKSKQNLGDTGPNNPKLRASISAVEKAQLDLEFTSIIAESDGVIESFNLDIGYFCSVGQPIATFISHQDVWIQADMRENNLSNIKIGDSVNYVLDIAPGKILSSKVSSIGYGVKAGSDVNPGGLPKVGTSNTGWLRQPQRFPVIIHLNDEMVLDIVRSGGQVDVVVYTGDSKVLNALARFEIWMVSKLSYVR